MFIVFALIIAILIGSVYSVYKSSMAVGNRDKLLNETFGETIKITRDFPISQNHEKIIQGALKHSIQSFRELIIDNNWLFIQITNGMPRFTLFEDRTSTTMSLFCVSLNFLSPTILIRNNGNKSILLRYAQRQIKDQDLIWCEAEFDKDHAIYNEKGRQIDTLSILSPEVLDALKNAPGNADILIKNNQLYYMIPGGVPAEKILKPVIKHSSLVVCELNENLERWARSTSNKTKLQSIKKSDLPVTLREQYERERDIAKK